MRKRLLLTLVLLNLIMLGCSPEEIVEEIETKEALYGKAVLELSSNKSDNTLDERYENLNKQINNILQGQQELNFAKFFTIKVELDYLETQEYNRSKRNKLETGFKKAFAKVQEQASKEDDYQGSTLSDRFYSLSEKMDEITINNEELKVLEYIKLQEGLVNLENDGYPVISKINELKSKLLALVMNELESAVINFEVPTFIEEVEEEIPIEQEKEKIIIDEGPKTHIVEIIDGGFSTKVVNLNIGDTIEWKNVRSGNYKVALLLGNGICRNVKSNIFQTGESYSKTFNEPLRCWISDGIFTTQAMKIIVS